MIPQVTSESSARPIFLRWYRVLNTKIVPPNKNDLKKHFRQRDRLGKQVENLIRLHGNYLEPRVRRPFCRERRHHCLLPRPRCNLNHPKQLIPFPERLTLPFPCEEILSGSLRRVRNSRNEKSGVRRHDRQVTSGNSCAYSEAEYEWPKTRTRLQRHRGDNNSLVRLSFSSKFGDIDLSKMHVSLDKSDRWSWLERETTRSTQLP